MLKEEMMLLAGLVSLSIVIQVMVTRPCEAPPAIGQVPMLRHRLSLSSAEWERRVVSFLDHRVKRQPVFPFCPPSHPPPSRSGCLGHFNLPIRPSMWLFPVIQRKFMGG